MANPNPTHKWKKGQSGNPSGRPKGMVNLTQILNNALQDDHVEYVTDETTGKKKKVTTNYGVLIIMKMLDMALAKGNDKMIKEIFDRIEGKAVQSINLGGQAGNPIELAKVDPETQASIEAMRARWFLEDKKKVVAKSATKRQPSGNHLATKKMKKVVKKKVVKRKVIKKKV